MPLNPQDIVRKEFREAFRGYNQAEVDLFLDEVVEEFTRAYEENQKMKVRIAALQQEIARFREGRPVTASSREEPERIESEVRSRVRRFLEDQLRQLESPATSPTVERMARDLQQTEAPPEKETPRADEKEPFWAGE